MGNSSQKTVLVAVSGCIAAYKSCEIVRGLQKAGYRVKVMMTEHATKFVGPTTFRALTNEPVAVGLFDDPDDPIHHVSLAAEADLVLVAPATANVMAKMAAGIADDLFSTTLLASTGPIIVAPAMNVHMYENAATQANMATLRQRGIRFIEADSGYLACGDTGKGRLAEPSEIVSAVCSFLSDSSALNDLVGKKVFVTAGPTCEPIDPVRFLTNRSSGKMGYAIAEAAARRGAEVTLVSGPVSLPCPDGVRLISVQSAQDMLNASELPFSESDIAIFCAAVADMRPATASDRKLKKATDGDALSHIELVENPDILRTLAAAKSNQVVVGFAAETTDVVENAKKKLVSKGADLIVANRVGDGVVFGQDSNKATFVTASDAVDLPEMNKSELADRLLDKVVEFNA